VRVLAADVRATLPPIRHGRVARQREPATQNFALSLFAHFPASRRSRETLSSSPASICSLFVFGDFGDIRRCNPPM
jgi:hypothetical protein